MTDVSNNIIAQVVKLSEGYVLQLTEGRTVGYPTVQALGKGLVRELRRKPKAVVTESATNDARVAPQAFNLSTLVSRAQAGEITREDFERGLQTYCPDVERQAWAQPAIETARAALQAAPPTPESLTPRVRDSRKKPAGPVPWVCGYCKRPSDCLFDNGTEMDLRGNLEAPCDTCQRCLDDECGGQDTPEEPTPAEGSEAPEGDDFELMQTEVRYIVNERGEKIGTVTE